MIWFVISAAIVLASAAVALFKYLFAREALRDVPPEQRVEVIDAVGRAFARWRVR